MSVTDSERVSLRHFHCERHASGRGDVRFMADMCLRRIQQSRRRVCSIPLRRYPFLRRRQQFLWAMIFTLDFVPTFDDNQIIFR